MKAISSRENALYKELKLLSSSAQARRKSCQTVLDGVHLCQTYLDAAAVPRTCVVSESALRHPEVAEIVRRCEEVRASCVRLPDALYQVLSQVENGVGLLFVIDTPSPGSPAQLAHAAVLLDNLQDPGNLGSILRSAAAAGIRSIYCSKGTVSPWSPKVLRAGMGAHFLMEIYENVDLVSLAKEATVPIIATSSHASDRVFDVDLNRAMAWLFGHEGQGISDALLDMAKYKVAIPHLGRIESLNVAACAAICLFEQVRQKTA